MPPSYTLPNEIFVEIMPLLPATSLPSLALTSRKIHHISNLEYTSLAQEIGVYLKAMSSINERGPQPSNQSTCQGPYLLIKSESTSFILPYLKDARPISTNYVMLDLMGQVLHAS